jgi:hypothetical protein
MAISDDGRFLFVETANGETVQAFAIAADGELTRVGGPVASGGGMNATPLTRPAAPRATLVGTPPEAGQAAVLNASGSSDAGAAITGYAWDFGDGTRETTSGPKAIHSYAKGGVYSASVTVLDDAGCGGFLFTGQDAYCDGLQRTKTIAIDEPPTISKLRARSGKHGPAFAYRLDEMAKVRLTIDRGHGRRAHFLGAVRARGAEGPNTAQAPKRLTKRLKAGSYTVLAIATDSAGGSSAPARATFKLKPAR